MFVPVINIFYDDKIATGALAKYFKKNDYLKPLKNSKECPLLLGDVYLLGASEKSLRKNNKHRLVLIEEDQESLFVKSEKKSGQSFDATFKTTELGRLENFLRDYNDELINARKEIVSNNIIKQFSSIVTEYEKQYLKIKNENFKWKSKYASKLFEELEYLIVKRAYLGEERSSWKDIYQLLQKSRVFKNINYDETGILLGVDCKKSHLLCLTRGEKQVWCSFEFSETVLKSEIALVLGHLNCYYDENYLVIPQTTKELKILTDAFSFFPNALCVVDEKGELLFHNTEFIKLGLSPNECLKQNTGDKVEVLNDANHLYILEKTELVLPKLSVAERCTLLTIKSFAKTNEMNLKSHDQLGIITSSLAHELNNPIGGLLAMVNLLELEEEFVQESESMSALLEIKAGTLKCKTMIDLLLGFSKTELHENKGPFIKESLEQALSLLTSRMIESNVKIQLKVENDHELKNFLVSAPILSMVYYMIFGQLITEFARLRLIRGNDQTILKVVVRLNFALMKVEMLLSESLDLRSFFLHSSLLGHLLLLENNTIEVLPKSIKFKYNGPDN
jgi:hypothetical protein